MHLSNRKALVTGGGRGIGRSISLRLAREGCSVVINYVKNRQKAEETAKEIKKSGHPVHVVRADVAKTGDAKRLIENAYEKLGGLDLLVNNAAVSFFQAWDEISEETWDRTIDTNLKGAFFCSKYAAEKMIASGNGGSIVNISSTNGRVAEADVLHYNASKGGLEMLTKSLAIELAPYGIRVNAVSPGLIETEHAMAFLKDPAFREHYFHHIPLGRFGSPDECTGAVVFFASEDSSYITGQSLVIDGGLIADQCPKLGTE